MKLTKREIEILTYAKNNNSIFPGSYVENIIYRDKRYGRKALLRLKEIGFLICIGNGYWKLIKEFESE